MKDFFISYNGADKPWAEWIAWQIEDASYSVIIQAWDFRPGSNFVLQMDKAAKQAARTIAVLSQHYLDATYTQPEWAAAFADDPSGVDEKLICVIVQEVELRGLLKQIVHINLVGLDERSARSTLIDGVKAARAKPSKAPIFPRSNFTRKRNGKPFPGLTPLPSAEPPGRLTLSVANPERELIELAQRASDPNLANREEFLAAVKAVIVASFEEKIYLRRLSQGTPTDISAEETLSRLWLEAWDLLRRFDQRVANLCLVKGYCWNDEKLRVDAKYSEILVGADRIFR
jgi:hypothetical protein